MLMSLTFLVEGVFTLSLRCKPSSRLILNTIDVLRFLNGMSLYSRELNGSYSGRHSASCFRERH